MIDQTKVVEFVQLFTRSGKQMAGMVASPCASQSLKHLVVMLNSYPVLRKTKVHLRHILLQHIEILDVSMTTHGSSFLQFLLLDSYHYDDSDHEVKPASGVDIDTWTILQSKDWATHGGSTEFQLLENSVTIEESKFGTLARNQAASHLIEVLLQVAPESAFTRLLETRFKNKMLEFIRHPVANFVVQKLIKCTRNVDQFNTIYAEIKPHMSEFYAGRSGVIMSLTQASLRFVTVQPIILDELITSIAAFSGTNAEELKKSGDVAKTIMSLSNTPKHIFKRKKTLERTKSRKSGDQEGEEGEKASAIESIEFSPIGCQLLSILFKFDPKIVSFILEDFMAMDTRHLLDMALNRVASRTFESFLLSPAVAHATKQTFAKNFAADASYIARLAQDKSGSHVLDQLFVSSTTETKAEIAEAVLSIEKALLAIHHGKFVLNNLRISDFRRNKEAWMKAESSKLVRKKAFDDILNFASDAARQSSANASSSKDVKKNKKGPNASSAPTDRKGEKPHGKPVHHGDKKDSHHVKKHERLSKDRYQGSKDDRKPKREGRDGPHQDRSNAGKKFEKNHMDVDQASASSKKRKREENPDDIDDIFSGFDEKEPTNKKAKSAEASHSKKASSSKPKSAPAASAPEAAPLSKLKQKKLAKAQKAAERTVPAN